MAKPFHGIDLTINPPVEKHIAEQRKNKGERRFLSILIALPFPEDAEPVPQGSDDTLQ